MRRIHPFVYGHIVAALIVGVAAGATLDAQAAAMGAVVLMAGAMVSSVVCWWKPGLEAPAWRLIPAAILANPLMLVALGFMAVDAECVVGNKRGWDCIGAADRHPGRRRLPAAAVRRLAVALVEASPQKADAPTHVAGRGPARHAIHCVSRVPSPAAARKNYPGLLF